MINTVSEKNYLPKWLHTLLNNLLSSLDRRNPVGGLFCDLQKAFDCVSHEYNKVLWDFWHS